MQPYTHLTFEERKTLCSMHKNGASRRSIAKVLNRSPSTIGREITRNSHLSYGYIDESAEYKSSKRRIKEQPVIVKNQQARAYVIEKLALKWTPEEIANTMKRNKMPFTVCTETIYRFIYSVDGQKLKLPKLLKRKKKFRCYRGSKREHPPKIPPQNSIHARSLLINNRRQYGHLEIDLVHCKDGNITTIVERKTRMAFAIKNTSKHSQPVIAGIIAKLQNLPSQLRRTITVDQGTEFAQHSQLSSQLGAHVYFCDPHSPWQKGANENFNGRLRRYFPRKSSLSHVTQNQLDAALQQMNHTPRKCLGYLTPAAAFSALLSRCCTSI